MLLAMFVEGKNDYCFFAQLVEHIKSFNRDVLTYEHGDAYMLDRLVGKHSKYVVEPKCKEVFLGKDACIMMFVGGGKNNTKKMFVEITFSLLTSDISDPRSLLIIDSDASRRPLDAVSPTRQKIEQLVKNSGFYVVPDVTDAAGCALALDIKNDWMEIKTGLMAINSNLDQFLYKFLIDNNLITKDMLKDDPKKAIQNVIDRENLNDFEGLCRFLFLNKGAEIKRHPALRQIIDGMCKLIQPA